MSEQDLYELIAMHVAQIDASFEFWLTISFAVLMAIHIIGNTMKMALRILLCGLYVAASFISILLYPEANCEISFRRTGQDAWEELFLKRATCIR